jgi:hypothetical protein
LEDFFWLIVFIFFIVLPALERVLRGGTRGRTPPPTARRRAPPAAQPRRLPQSRAEQDRVLLEQQAREAERRTAAEMIPPGLWEVLTGERLPSTAPRGLPQRRPPAWDEEADTEEEEAEEAARTRPEALPVEAAESEEAALDELLSKRRRETIEQRRVVHPPPQIVSLETEPAVPAGRHAAFHQRVGLSAPAKVQRPADMTLPLRNRDRAELRKAILIQEVLGRPKGLE